MRLFHVLSKTQIPRSRYFEYFEKINDNEKEKENIYFILVPEYRREEIELEIKDLENHKDEMKGKWHLLSYKEILEFFEKHKEKIEQTKYKKYYEDIVTLFRRQSFDKQKLYQLKLTKNKINSQK